MRPSSPAPLLSASSPKGSPRPSSPTPQLPVNPPTPQLPSNPTPQLPVKVFLKKESNKKLGIFHALTVSILLPEQLY